MVNYPGLISLLSRSPEPFALLTMQATSTTGRLMRAFPDRFRCLFSAQGGFFGPSADSAASAWHPYWNRPIHPLDFKVKPTDEMFAGVGRMVIDLCDIGVRCYTFLATVKATLEACAARGIPVVVLDRQLPMGGVVDGPRPAPGFVSPLAPVDVPFCHGMTPGECAVWLKENGRLDLDLSVVRLVGWSHRDCAPWPNFIPPSPAIRSWDSAALYPMSVFTEAYPAVDCDRGGALAFRVVGAPWLDQRGLVADLAPSLASCGVEMRPYRYVPAGGKYRGLALNGILFSVAKSDAYYPATASVLVLAALLRRHGGQLQIGARPAFLDELYGSTGLRDALAADTLSDLFQTWIAEQNDYLRSRVNLYR